MIAEESHDIKYAGLLPRGAAYLIDCAIVFGLFAVTQLFVFTFLRTEIGIDDEWFRSGTNTEIYTLLTISFPVWLYFILFERSAWKATIGKRLMGLRVAKESDGKGVGFKRAFFRTIVKLLPWEVAHLANNLPEPLCYASEPDFRFGFLAVGALMGLYIAMIILSAKNQGLHDVIARTVVVKER